MSDINNEARVEQLAEGLAEELGREPTQAEVEEQVELRECDPRVAQLADLFSQMI